MVVFATVVLEKIELGGATVAQGVILENEWLTREWLVEYAEVDDETLAIPEEAGFKGIADQAFVGFTGKRIVLPRGLIYIGKGLGSLRRCFCRRSWNVLMSRRLRTARI